MIDKSKLIFVSFYTEGYYKQVFEKYLRPSLDKFELDFIAIEKNNLHDWTKNGKYKTEVLLDVLSRTKQDIVFLDADAQIVKFPELLYQIPLEYNIGVHFLDWYKFWHGKEKQSRREVLTGTIYLRNNPETIKFVEEWNKINQNSLEWGQKILQQLLNQNKIAYYNLPLEYCKILTSKNLIRTRDIIVQHQTSREIRQRKIDL
jgi:hypothetical protein